MSKSQNFNRTARKNSHKEYGLDMFEKQEMLTLLKDNKKDHPKLHRLNYLLSIHLGKAVAILDLFQKGRAIESNPKRFGTELDQLLEEQSVIEGEFYKDAYIFLCKTLTKDLQRRVSYRRHRKEKNKLTRKLKIINNSLNRTKDAMNDDGQIKYKTDDILLKACVDKDFEEAYKIFFNAYKRIKSCNKTVGVYVKKGSSDVKLATDMYCNSRWCPICAERRKEAIRKKYSIMIETVKNPYLLTLTLKNTDDLNDNILKRLTGAIKKLWEYRKDKYKGSRSFFKNIKGFIRSVEIKPKKNGEYNLHAHLVCECDESWTNENSLFEINQQISKEWLEETGDSKIVDFRKIDINKYDSNFTQAIKYIVKPQDFIDGRVDQIFKIMLTFYRKHIMLPYGEGVFRNNPLIKEAMELANSFDSQETLEEIQADIDSEENNNLESECESLEEYEKKKEDLERLEKEIINFVAFTWVDAGNGKRERKLLPERDSIVGGKWILKLHTKYEDAKYQQHEKVYGVGFCED